MEKLFSKADISDIELKARNNLEFYLDTVVFDGQTTEKTIITISKNKQLIFIEGNEDTGWVHLRDRHNFFSVKNYWVKQDEKIKLGGPSKFYPKMIPIIDFVKIASHIYSSENKNITKNNNPELFDKYSGTYVYDDGYSEIYHLLTYKDSKVVHTLYPKRDKQNRKSKTKYGRGIATTSLKFPDGICDLVIPYENNNNIPVYSIIFRRVFAEQIENLIIQEHDLNGKPETHFIIATKPINGFESFGKEDII